MNEQQLFNVTAGRGFIAALDQSGGSTPKALADYGVPAGAYTDEQAMFDLIHEMRSRLMQSPAFDGRRIIGAILFEQTLKRKVDGRPTPEYLWTRKGIVPFLKVDRGLADETDQVRLMRPIPDLPRLLDGARAAGVFGTKMRSVVTGASPRGIASVLDQQFEVARVILASGLVPILEPEVDIHSPEKDECERILRTGILERLDSLRGKDQVMLKLSIPSEDGYYGVLVEHPRVIRVLALSGGYTRAEACRRLTRNPGVIASFSRALVEGLQRDQPREVFDAALEDAVEQIYQASA